MAPERPESAAPSFAGRPSEKPVGMDGIGQRSEMLRVRFSRMIDRLEELKSLGDEFNEMIEPLDSMFMELPQAKARVQETEALLAREIHNGRDLRREVESLSNAISSLQAENANLDTRQGKLEGELVSQTAVAEERLLLLSQKMSLIETLERQVAGDAEHREHLEAELGFKRAENLANEQALDRAEASLRREMEQGVVNEGEIRRLRILSETQAEKLGLLEARNAELLQQRENQQLAFTALEARMAGEVAFREKLETDSEAALAQGNAERATLGLKLEAVTARLSTTEQILESTRNHFREKDDALRAAERSLKELALERTTLGRRLESARAEIERYLADAHTDQRGRKELEERNEMLNKALAAKDALVENATTRIGSLNVRLETATARFESDRIALEAANRRLVEELEGERAERTLAQGALEIARDNRVALQRQNEVLRRAARMVSVVGEDDHARAEDGQTVEPSNVSPFSPKKNP
ncbi:hypothetical protein [Aureimonas psammosilenae]|uniref:hypothetical protein n=1 Tax=Aureimonas psammosilenae TaxID=2495496 RepID=UPI0012611DCE|nr:hypothetical protein [Aureimonas psammosilenae]